MNRQELESHYSILSKIEESGSPVGANALSLELNIPPATLGRKLQVLEHQGYIRKVSNRGRILTDSGRKYLAEIQAQLYSVAKAEELRVLSMSTEKQDMLDMLSVRRVLEAESVTLACRNITNEEIQELEEIVRKQDREKAAGRAGEQQDLKFHLKLAQISGNKCIEHVLTLILMQDGAYVKLSLISQVAKNLPHAVSHSKVIQALRDRNEEAARELLSQHIGFYMKYVEDYC